MSSRIDAFAAAEPNEEAKDLMLVATYIWVATKGGASRDFPFLRQLARVLRRGQPYVDAVCAQVALLLQARPSLEEAAQQLGSEVPFVEGEVVITEDESLWDDVRGIEHSAPGLLGDLLEVVGGTAPPIAVMVAYLQLLEQRELKPEEVYESEVAAEAIARRSLDPVFPGSSARADEPRLRVWPGGEIRLRIIGPRPEPDPSHRDGTPRHAEVEAAVQMPLPVPAGCCRAGGAVYSHWHAPMILASEEEGRDDTESEIEVDPVPAAAEEKVDDPDWP
jgi:hypothetical protein